MILNIIVSVVVALAVVYLGVTVIFPNFLKKFSEQMLMIAKEKLDSEQDKVKTDIDNKKEAIEKAIKQIHEELERSRNHLTDSDKERVGSFRELKKELENQRHLTDQLSATTKSLKDVLSNNQMRGQFGEQVAENLLKMSGFVKGVDYSYNKEQKESGTRPDFTVFLPNNVKINVDVKFPYQNIQRMSETEDKATKQELKKAFVRDIKEKIKQVTTRDYINPENNTVDFVIMFVPNEMVFSFIYESMNDVWTEAMRQKVVFAGPFSFTAILRLVRQAYDNFRYQKNVQKIIGYIKNFEIEFGKYNEEFTKIGERIESLSKQYDDVNTTRTRQLIKSVEKVKLEDSSEPLLLNSDHR